MAIIFFLLLKSVYYLLIQEFTRQRRHFYIFSERMAEAALSIVDDETLAAEVKAEPGMYKVLYSKPDGGGGGIEFVML